MEKLEKIIKDTIKTAVNDKKIRVGEPYVMASLYNEFMINYIKKNKQMCYSDKELVGLYNHAKPDFLRYMKDFYKVK